MHDDTKLAVSRLAARLFLERGVRGTTGDDIAEAAGLSTRTIWRYFGTKENCVAPLLYTSSLRFTSKLRAWPRNLSIEEYLHQAFGEETKTPQEIADELLVTRLVAMLPEEPALRAAYLMSAQAGEEDLTVTIADRLLRSARDPEVRTCGATIMAAIRILDETISTATIHDGQTFTREDIIDRVGRAIRAASTLPICDPVV